MRAVKRLEVIGIEVQNSTYLYIPLVFLSRIRNNRILRSGSVLLYRYNSQYAPIRLVTCRFPHFTAFCIGLSTDVTDGRHAHSTNALKLEMRGNVQRIAHSAINVAPSK